MTILTKENVRQWRTENAQRKQKGEEPIEWDLWVKQHETELSQPIPKIPIFLEEPTNPEEVGQIMEFLGRKHDSGDVRGDHLAKILTYLQQTQNEDYDKTNAKLSLLCAMAQRQLRENYLEGLEAFGIIRVSFGSKTKTWEWVGLRQDEPAEEKPRRKQKPKKEKDGNGKDTNEGLDKPSLPYDPERTNN